MSDDAKWSDYWTTRSEKNGKSLWIRVSRDELQLPLCVCDTCEELAENIGVTVKTIQNLVANPHSTYKRVRYTTQEWLGDIF